MAKTNLFNNAVYKGTGQNNYTRTGTTLWVGGGALKDTTYLRTLPTTFYWLLNLSWHRNIQLARVGIKWQTRKVRFESHCNFLLLDRVVAMQQRHHLLMLCKGGVGRHHQLFCGLVGPVRV